MINFKFYMVILLTLFNYCICIVNALKQIVNVTTFLKIITVLLFDSKKKYIGFFYSQLKDAFYLKMYIHAFQEMLKFNVKIFE